MIDPMTLSLILAGAKTGLGALQAYKGNKAAKSAIRSEYEIPSAVNEQLKLAKAQALQTQLPGQSQIESNISGGVQTGIRAAKESGDPVAMMATISALNANQNQAYNQLGVQGAQFKQQNMANLQNVLGNYGQYQDKAFGYNKDEPYRNKAAAAEALKGSGIQNIASGLSDAAGIGMQSMANKQQGDMMSKWFGANKTIPTGSTASNANTNVLQSMGINTQGMTAEQIAQTLQILGLS